MTLDRSDSGMMNAEHNVVAFSQSDASALARSKLVVALDRPTVEEAYKLIKQLGNSVEIYKVGLELVLSPGGLAFAEQLQREGKKIFLDMKLLDIPNTVEKAVANVARLGFDFLTVHGIDRKTLDAAIRGRDSVGPRLKLLSVTVLTSISQRDLNEQGVSESPRELVVRRAKMACDAGFDGVIASGHEACLIKTATTQQNANFIIKVPGIRLADSAAGDQTRVMTPAQAIDAGATYLVIGRPITEAKDPLQAVHDIVDEISLALRKP